MVKQHVALQRRLMLSAVCQLTVDNVVVMRGLVFSVVGVTADMVFVEQVP